MLSKLAQEKASKKDSKKQTEISILSNVDSEIISNPRELCLLDSISFPTMTCSKFYLKPKKSRMLDLI
jgi:hypothetical protein